MVWWRMISEIKQADMGQDDPHGADDLLDF